jgi:hypothetical protein
MTEKMTEKFAAGVVDIFKRIVDGPRIKGRFDALEQRIAKLEAQPKALTYCGTWQRAAEYVRHQGTTHRGQLWVSVAESTRAEPGTNADWQLRRTHDDAWRRRGSFARGAARGWVLRLHRREHSLCVTAGASRRMADGFAGSDRGALLGPKRSRQRDDGDGSLSAVKRVTECPKCPKLMLALASVQ